MSDLQKPDFIKRALAAIIDGVVMTILTLIPLLGKLLALIYLLLRDGLDFDFMRHRSLGKSLMKLKPVTLAGEDLDLGTSAKRNITLALGSLAQLIKGWAFLSWLLMLAAIVVGLYEVYLVITDDKGRRLGDRLAETQVIESGD